ncbi:hypothetical protein HOP50_01g07550 [Chloropicon primus]|uniref:DUF1343 domain-containing protein n=1 Tax=Chloropicon primus TaxID=1764295 RepID=A0A5B8MCZ0_9CHLO|nr:hypothetical protein A3770_01p07710 [Chloropicon primus]UPQ97464.1 hypothetical protein HOP50_01g07550 [Chloropicon primus]|eukprot:QDZ18253.1 hypothetical protein A3770_01p07710 [Chloropicon primus]
MAMARGGALVAALWAVVLALSRPAEATETNDNYNLRGGARQGGVTTTGLDRMCSSPSFAKVVTGGKPTCILAHAASVLPDLTHAVDALAQTSSGVKLTSVLAPEHGFRGAQQAGHGGKNSTVDPRTGLQVYSIYLKGYEQILSLMQKDGSQVVLVDLQDCGARFYTYIWSLYDVLVAAAGSKVGGQGAGYPVKVVVLDRPNPLGGERIGGPVLDADFSSGVGKRPLSMQHGMTIGELANLFNEEYVGLEDFSKGNKADLQVVTMENWRRELSFTDTGLPYVPPSPNLPTPTSVYLYVGLGLIEGVNISEGRGTALPFQLIGAPYMGWEYADALRKLQMDGTEVREAYFVPVMSKHANQTCGGVEVSLPPKGGPQGELDAIRVGIQVIKLAHDMYKDQGGFDWVKSGSRYWIDLLTGNELVRTGIESGLQVDQIVAQWQHELEWFKILAQKYLLYQ